MLLCPAALCAVVCLLLCAAPASAETITVPITTTQDAVAADGTMSLREALRIDAGAGNDLVLTLPAGTYRLGSTVTSDARSGASITIRGAGARETVLDGQGLVRVMDNPAGSTLVLEDVALTRGRISGIGSIGGGLNNEGTARLTRAAVTASQAGERGGGIGNLGSMTIVHSAITGNRANGLSSDPITKGGGGIANSGQLRMVGSTVSGNVAFHASQTTYGGGLFQSGAGAMTVLESTTFADNRADNGAGGTFHAQGATSGIEVFGSLVTGGLPTNCNAVTLTRPSSGDTTMASDATCGVTAAPTLTVGALADNGGPTDTNALPAGSPAIDAAETCSGDTRDALTFPATDQRGLPRPIGAACDLGAFEVQPPAPPAGDDAPAGTGTPPAVVSPPVLTQQGPAATVPAPAPVSALALRPARFRAGTGRGRGTRVRYRLAAPATVRFTVERVTTGRRVGGRCTKPARSNRARAACNRRSLVKGALLRVSQAGTRTFRFTGVVGGRTLKPGRYALVAVVRSGGRRSTARRAAFTITRPRG